MSAESSDDRNRSASSLDTDPALWWPRGQAHPAEATLLAYMDDELPPAMAARVRDHLPTCVECERASDEIRELATVVTGALDLVDTREPAAWNEAPRPLVLPASAAHTRRSNRIARPAQRPAVLWAAAAVLLVAGAASAATIWRVHARAAAHAEAQRTAHASAAAATQGIVVPFASGDSLLVVVSGAARGSRLIVAREDTLHASVRVEVSAAGTPTFRPAGDTIALSLSGVVGIVRVYMPPDAGSARVVANGRTAVRIANGTIMPETARSEGVVVTW